MTCYTPTQGCGVYENSSCSECPYSKPPKAEVLSKEKAFATIALGRECQICGDSFAIYNWNDTRQFCHECLNRLNRILYPERK